MLNGECMDYVSCVQTFFLNANSNLDFRLLRLIFQFSRS
jgi:hypothetical protein